MKIIYVANFSQVRSTEGYIADAIDSYKECDLIRLQESQYSANELIDKLRQERPEYVLFSKMELRDLVFNKTMDSPDMLQNLLGRMQDRGIKPVAWLFDLMRNEFSQPRYRWSHAVARYCQMFITTDSYNLGLTNHRCLRQGCAPPEPNVQIENKLRFFPHEVLHVGGLYGPRKAWSAALTHRLGGRYGVVRSLFEDRLREVCDYVKLVVGPPYPFFAGYWSNRIYLVTGYGACFVGPMVRGMEEEGWKDGENMICCPQSPEAAAEQIFDLLKDKEKVHYVARNGMEFVWQNHTYRHRARVLLDWLKGSQLQGGASDAGTDSQTGRESVHRQGHRDLGR